MCQYLFLQFYGVFSGYVLSIIIDMDLGLGARGLLTILSSSYYGLRLSGGTTTSVL